MREEIAVRQLNFCGWRLEGRVRGRLLGLGACGDRARFDGTTAGHRDEAIARADSSSPNRDTAPFPLVFVVFGAIASLIVGPGCRGSAAPSSSEMEISLADVSQAAFGGWIQAGVPYRTRFSIGVGAALGDLDGDGDIDIVLARAANPPDGESAGPSLLLRNVTVAGGSMRFEADQSFAGLAADANANGAAIGDYDADGDLDIFLACEGTDRLYRNDGAGKFSDVTAAAGVLGDAADTSSGALFVDLNSDGLLDLYVTNYHHGDLSVPPQSVDANRLYIAVGDGTFFDATAEAGLTDLGATHTAEAADLDGDGVLELYVANDAFNSSVDFPHDALYVRQSITSEGVPLFVDAAGAKGAAAALRSTMGIAVRDFDGDGRLDIYLTDWGANDLLVSDTEGYKDRAQAFGIENAETDGSLLIGWGALPLDLDHDGALELFVVNGDVVPIADSELGYEQLDFYFRQPAIGARFDDVTARVGLPTSVDPADNSAPAAGRGAYGGDLDGDGDTDVLLGAYGEPYRAFENRTVTGGHYVRLRLVGTASAADPIGAVVRIRASNGRSVSAMRTIGGETYGQSDSVIESGLANALPMRVDVIWPSGLQQRIDGLAGFAPDREVLVREPDWLTVSTRIATLADAPPVLTIQMVGEDGSRLAAEGAGHAVVVTRSDGVPVDVDDKRDGSYEARLVHPGMARRTRVTVSIDERVAGVSPVITYR